MQFILFLLLIIVLLGPGCASTQKQAVKPLKNNQLHKPGSTLRETKKNAPRAIRKHPDTLTLEELQQVKEYCTAIGDTETAIIYSEKMFAVCSEHHKLKDLTLELADLFFDRGELEKALKHYMRYLVLYPGSDQRAYVHYKAILTRFYMILAKDRDQSRTREALVLSEQYCKKIKTDKTTYEPYYDEVNKIRMQCCQKLFEHEKYIFDHYYRKGSYQAAETRLAHMKKEYIDRMPSTEPELIVLECDLAKKQNDTILLAQKEKELAIKFPDYATQQIILAQNKEQKIDYVSRF